MSIVLEQLTKRYEGYPVVNNVSLEVADGEFFVLLGPSGSGKSTILRMIAGLAGIDAGRVVLHGRDVTAQPPQQRGTGFVRVSGGAPDIGAFDREDDGWWNRRPGRVPGLRGDYLRPEQGNEKRDVAPAPAAKPAPAEDLQLKKALDLLKDKPAQRAAAA